MNKNYKVVWSDARNAFVAVSENTKSKGKPKSAVRSAIAVAVGALFLAPAAALAFNPCPATTTISSALTSSQCYNNNESVTITSTGSVSVTDTSLAPAAVYFSNSGNYTGAFSNSGTINSTIMGAGGQQGYGVYFFTTSSNLLAGSMSNAGVINVMTSSSGSGGAGNASSYGMHAGYGIAPGATLTNTGTINVTAAGTNTMTAGSAVGVQLFGSVDGVMTNAGSLNISATANGIDYASAQATGISIGDVNGQLVNSGTIKATAQGFSSSGGGYSYSAYAYGIQFGTVGATGQFVNSGTISASAQFTGPVANAYAYGITGNGVNGSFTNTGTITSSATANGIDSANATAYGASFGSIGTTGSFMNAGTISAAAIATGSLAASGANVQAYGARLSTIDGVFNNSGRIEASATYGGAGYAYSSALAVNSNDISATGSFTNSGTISATTSTPSATGGSQTYAYGAALGTIDGTFNNTASGVISATATSESANSYGVTLGNVNGSFTNAGVITATATGTTNSATAYGVILNDMNGTLTNSGAIRATATGPSGQAYGISVNSLNGTINNSGTISATVSGGITPDNAYSIYAGSGSGTVNNMAGGLLEGKVALNGAVNLNNAGVLDTRQQTSTVGGNYTQAATGTLRIGAMDNAKYGSVNVGGTASLAAGTTISLKGAAGHTLAAGTLSNVITSGGLTMSTVNVTDNVLALNYAAMMNGNNVDLVATSTGLTSVAATVPGSMGSVGGVLDSMLANIDNLPKELQTYLYALGSQTTAQGVTDTVKKIQPMIVASTTQSGIGAAQGAGNVVLARLDSAQGRSAGDKFYGDSKFWVKPFGSWADQDDRGGVTGYKARTAGMVGGVDADVKDYRLGLAIGYARSDVDGNSAAAPQSAKVASYQFMAYGSRALSQDMDVNFLAGFGLHDNTTRRIIGLGGGASAQANASYGSTSANIGAGLAKTLAFGSNSTFTPSLRADYTWFRSNSYIESGAGALGLNVNSNDVAMFVVAADGKYVRQISERQKFSANFGVGFDLINERTTITSAFAGAPTAAFATQGMKLDPWIVRGGLGYTYRTAEKVEITTRYDLDVRSGFTNQTVSLTGRWSF